MGRLTIEIPIGTKRNTTSLSLTQRTSDIDSWKASIPEILTITDRSTVSIKRDGTEILRGRVFNPPKAFGKNGSRMDVKGLGYARELNRFITGSGTVTSKTVSDAIQEVLDNSPSSHSLTLGTVETFYFSKTQWEYKTTTEFLCWTFSDTGIEFDMSGTEITAIDVDGVNNNRLPDGNLRCTFADIRGRIFVFWVDAANNVKFSSSTDGGATWAAATDTTYNANASALIDTTYDPDDDHVHMAIYSGAVTAIYTGTITAGAIAWVNDNASIFAANRSPRCSIIYGNETDHIWTIDSANHLWESVDDGANWTDHGAMTETAKFCLPKDAGDPGDMYILEYDAVNDILELWWWDDSTTTEAKVKDLYDFGASGDVMDGLTATLGHDGSLHITCNDDDQNVHYIMVETDETVTTRIHTPGDNIDGDALTIFVDNGDSAYVGYTGPAAHRFRKYTDGVFVEQSTEVGVSGAYIQSPIKNKAGFNDQGGWFVEGGHVGAAADIHHWLFNPEGIRIARGHTTGQVETTTKSATGDFERWGLLNALMTDAGDITYDVEDNGGVDLVANLSLIADLHVEGVPITETDLQIEVNFSRTGSNEPMLQELYLSERWTKIDSIPYDYEPIGNWLKKLAKYTLGEFDLNTDDTIDFKDELGSDISASVTLEEGVNCKDIKVDVDSSDYANVVMVIGSSINVTVRDSSEITSEGEWWTRPIRDNDITTNPLAYERGSNVLTILKVTIRTIKASFIDETKTGTISRGDTIQVTHPATGLNETSRIISLTRTDKGKGEEVSAVLVNAKSAENIIDYWGELEDLRRQSL